MTYDKDSFLAGLSVGMSLRYSKRIPAPVNCLTFSSPNQFTLSVYNLTKNWDGTLEYSTDARNWNVWDGTTVLTASVIVGTYRLYLRGIGNTIITGSTIFHRFVLTGQQISCNGNIETLLDYSVVLSGQHPIMSSGCYYGLFYGCAALVSAPELPALSLAYQCYQSMFEECSSLIHAPSLPATELSVLCYGSMFQKCAGLVAPPELPALSLANQCYEDMFRECSSLIHAPSLPATELKNACYSGMFQDCINLMELPALKSLWLPWTCYNSMFLRCAKIKLSQTQDENYSTAYRIPVSGTGDGDTLGRALGAMFSSTGGTFTGTPTINTTYYTSNTVIS